MSSHDATSSPQEKALDKLADVHRGWCNYCRGDALVCLNAPSGGCALRDYMIALDAPLSETVAPGAAETFYKNARLTDAEVDEIGAEAIRFLRAMADMGVVLKKPAHEIASIEKQVVPDIEKLCAQAKLAPPSSTLPPLGSTASVPESDADAKKFLDRLFCKPVDGVTYAEVHRLLWIALALQEKAARVSATGLPDETLTLELARALLRMHNDGMYGHLIRAGNFYSVLDQAKKMVGDSTAGTAKGQT